MKNENIRKMNIGVVGCRNFEDYEKFKYLIKDYKFASIISGECKSGVDQMAKRYALENNIKYIPFPPRMEYGPERFRRRNEQIVNASELIVAMPSKNSKGTRMTINIAKSLKVPCDIIEI